MGWTAADLPDQHGRTVVVTGANSGLGEAAATALAGAGARVVLACRDTGRGDAAAARMGGDTLVLALDLADLTAIQGFARRAADEVGPIDVLINNAGIMAVPQRRTADGFELQVGTNFLGHFALTGLLLPHITDRVVTLSSVAHRLGRISLDDLNWRRRRYQRWLAYGQSKLADLMFAYELARRLERAGSPVRSLAAHPGYAATELQSHTESIQDRLMSIGNRVVAQDAAHGALPALYAASMSDAGSGEFYGPDGIGEVRGSPRRVGSSRSSKDTRTAGRLWDLAAELTGVSPDVSSTVRATGTAPEPTDPAA